MGGWVFQAFPLVMTFTDDFIGVNDDGTNRNFSGIQCLLSLLYREIHPIFIGIHNQTHTKI